MECSQAPEQDGSPSTTRNETSDMESRSIKSSSSTESFKSAISLQEVDLDIARQVKAVQALMHAFRTALQILYNLIESRMPDKSGEVYIAAKELQDSLYDRSKEINDKHLAKSKEYGQIYLGRFTTEGKASLESAQILTHLSVSAKLQEISSKIMQEVVTKLHEFSAEHEELQKSGFHALCECSENCSRQIIMYLNQLAPPKDGLFDHEFLMELPTLSDTNPIPSPCTGQQFQGWASKAGEKTPVWPLPTLDDSDPDSSPDQECLAISPPNDARELSLPFLGYTFKRFDNSKHDTPSIPTATQPVPPGKPFVLDKEQITHRDDLLVDVIVDAAFKPDSKHDILQNFDFDWFLRQDNEDSKFNIPADDQLSSLPASHYPYTPVHASCSILPAEEELPIYINVKQSHRILRRRAARQALEEGSTPLKPHRPPSDTLKEEGARNNETPVVQAFDNIISPTSMMEGRTQGEKALTPSQVCTFSPPSGTLCIPVDTHSASQLPDPNRVRAPGASSRFRKRRRQLENEARERDANRINEKSTGPTANPALPRLVPSANLLFVPIHMGPSQLHFSTTPSGSYSVPIDLPSASRSANEKRPRNAGASARFRKRRRQKEKETRERDQREKKVEGNLEPAPETSTGSHQPFALPQSEDSKLTTSPQCTMHVNPSTGLQLNISSYTHPPTQEATSVLPKPVRGSYMHCFLSRSQERRLWWRSFVSIHLHNYPAFEVLHYELTNELGILTNFMADDETICKQMSSDIQGFGEVNQGDGHQFDGLKEILEIKSNVLRIVSTINEQLGLQVATLGWSCVCIFLHVSFTAIPISL
jgi:hypothetical protein